MRNRLHTSLQQVDDGLGQRLVAGKVFHHQLNKAQLWVTLDRERQLSAPADAKPQPHHPPQLDEELQLLPQLLEELQLLELQLELELQLL